jgi:hypothetical protein
VGKAREIANSAVAVRQITDVELYPQQISGVKISVLSDAARGDPR